MMSRAFMMFAFSLILAASTLAGHAVAAEAKPGTVIRDCSNCPDMVVIPAGKMAMGSSVEEEKSEGVPDQFAPLERPQHTVTIGHPFAAGKTEVTRGQFAAYIKDSGIVLKGGCNIRNIAADRWDDLPDKSWQDPGYPQTDAHPVVCINWDEAKAYTDWLSKKTGKHYRLLTEAEWEYAARGGVSTPRFWGDSREQACQYANIRDIKAAPVFSKPEQQSDRGNQFSCNDGYIYSSPVASFKPNQYGLYDMLGNAVEWTEDCAHDNYTGSPTDGSAWNETGCTDHLERGGSWIAPPWVARADRRHWTPHHVRLNMLGFRLERDLD